MRKRGRAASFVAAALLLSFGVGPVAVPLAMADTQRVSVTTLRPGSLVIAHRGASAVAPENTLPAMRKAAALGADMVEFDVQRTADRTLVVVHDKTFARTTDVASVFPGREHDPISSFTWHQVQRLDAGSWFSPTYAGTRVPTLAQLLEAPRPLHIRLLLDLKNPTLYPGYEKQVADQLQHYGYVDSHRVWVHSFDADSLERLHDLLPSVPVGLITKTGTVPTVDSTWLSSVNALSATVTDANADTAMRTAASSCRGHGAEPTASDASTSSSTTGSAGSSPTGRMWCCARSAAEHGVRGSRDHSTGHKAPLNGPQGATRRATRRHSTGRVRRRPAGRR